MEVTVEGQAGSLPVDRAHQIGVALTFPADRGLKRK